MLGHRIKVQHVALWHERQGMSAEEIVATYPTLSLSAVYAALAYYHAHRKEIDDDIEADNRFIEELKSNSMPSILQEKLKALHAKDDSVSPGG